MAAVGILATLVVGWSMVDSHRAAWFSAASTSRIMAIALSREVAGIIESEDLALQSAVRAVTTPTFETLGTGARHQLLSDVASAAKSVGDILVIDADGQVVDASGGAAQSQASVADRDYFLVHKDDTITGLFISRPFRSHITHKRSIALSRRITGPDGSFAGVVMDAIPDTAFAKLFAAFDIGPRRSISLVEDDGTILHQTSTGPRGSGKSLLDSFRDGHVRSQDGTFASPKERTLVAFSRVDTLPMVLSVTMTLATVYAGWTLKTSLLGAISLTLLATGYAMLRALRKQERELAMAERREAELSEQGHREVDRHHAGKIEAISRLTAGIAHDFNNHLQTITSGLDIISADYLRDPEAREIARMAHKAASNGARLTHRLLTFSRQQVLQPRRIGVALLLSDLRKLIADSRVFEAEIRCKIAVEPFTDDLHVDATQVESCLLNLLLNARDAMPQGGTLHLRARNATAEDRLFGSLTPGRHVVLTVRDSGRGMDDATRDHAFEPFFTTKAFGSGAGLGLSTAQGFCRQSGGEIRILGNRGEPGTTVEVWLPAATPDMPLDEEAEFNYATIGRRTGRLLLVEDEHDVLVALSAILVSAGFEVVSVNNGADGLMRLHDRMPFDAVLTDHAMPDMTGTEFLACVAAEMPDLPMLILSGGEVTDAALSALPRSVRLLRKPIRRLGLLNAVREVIGERGRLPVERAAG